ncbi:MAG: DNA cytosine methyltransferase [Lentimicrobiaceae bacterium]|nr:DNA cytosine methyltransferase [Lentimicrobiaceae bacterium]
MQHDYIDIFAGCGGLSFGLHNAGWKGLFAVEKNVDAFSTLQKNLLEMKNSFSWPKWLTMLNHDINDLLKCHKKELSALQGSVTLVVGGPPCQGFSMAGKRNSSDTRNKLVSSYLKFIQVVKPEILFFENVHGFSVGFSSGEKREIPYSEKIVKTLGRMGYRVHWELIDVSAYGIPQRRKRFILVGSQKTDPNIFFEALARNRLGFLQARGLDASTTVEQAIGDLRKMHGEIDCPDSKNYKAGIYGKANSAYQKLMRKNIPDIELVPNSHRYARHRADTEILFKAIMQVSDEPKRISPSHNVVEGLKKRGVTPLKPDYPCNTLTSIPDDYIHYSEPRVLTVREMARIQGFPDVFEFEGKYTTGGKLRKVDVPRYTQVANAIPPLFSEQVGLALKELL